MPPQEKLADRERGEDEDSEEVEAPEPVGKRLSFYGRRRRGVALDRPAVGAHHIDEIALRRIELELGRGDVDVHLRVQDGVGGGFVLAVGAPSDPRLLLRDPLVVKAVGGDDDRFGPLGVEQALLVDGAEVVCLDDDLGKGELFAAK